MAGDTAQLILFVVAITLLTPLFGRYMAKVYSGKRTILTPVLAPVEAGIYRLGGIIPDTSQHWGNYAKAALLLNLAFTLLFYLILRIQYYLPLNPRAVPGLDAGIAFNTAISFITSTNWQVYSGETDLSYLSQMIGCTVQNFVSTATAMAVAIAIMRGLTTSKAEGLGNFQTDFVRSILYILLPISLVIALIMVFEGVPQTLHDYITVTTVNGAEQTIARGPVASQVAIKMLGTNGGGFFSANAAHPFENPTPLSNFIQCLAMLSIPAALTYTFGVMTGNTRQGWALFASMMILFVAGLAGVYAAEGAGNPLIAQLPIDQTSGNMEGKEVRFGTASSALLSVIATTTAGGATNSALNSYTPLGGLVPMMNVQLNELIFGGAGSGFYNLLMFILLAVCLAGYLVGRTPIYLGKTVGVREIKLVVLILLCVPIGTLLVPAIVLTIPSAAAAIHNRGPHGLSELLYAYASAMGTNGSAFAGFDGTNTFHLVAMAFVMLLGRYAFIIGGLAIAGSLGAKRTAVVTSGSVRTDTPLFVVLMILIIFVFGAMMLFPAISLGPIAEYFEMLRGRSF
jgi:K+-transporting ATPase ATPase A chain